ncbi:glycosyltransferase family 39 protein [Lawsonibacter hominis]|uniref:Glycosyltransferase family 39 protein n=1 Tax=Lawsonibacter hominis TaxID=2763053 RepID=A0A8J6J2H7_9FIRM|nr:glycosyltransferase family 39 protein [Lawsonibacter hominis]
MHLLWSVLISALVALTGLLLLLRWLGDCGAPVPLGTDVPAERGVLVAPRECAAVFGTALLFRILIFLAAALLAGRLLGGGGGSSWALDLWKKWDAWHYVNLAELGYEGYVENGQHLFVVFFPLYVWLVRLAARVIGNTMAAGLLVSFLSFGGGCVYLYRLAAWEYGRSAARWTLVFLSVFPYAFFFGGVMTESLFLLTTAASLWHIRRHHWLPAGVWGALAALTRMHGVLLILAAGAELVQSLGRFDWKRIFRTLPALLLPLLGTLVYLGLNWSVTGTPFGFTEMQKHWSQGFCWISETLWYVLQNAVSYYDETIRLQLWVPTLVLFPVFFGVLLAVNRRCRSMYTLYAFATLVLDYSLSWLLSAGRYLSCAVPFFLFAAVLTQRHRGASIALAAGGAVLFAVTLLGYLAGGQIM